MKLVVEFNCGPFSSKEEFPDGANNTLNWTILWCRIKGHPRGIVYFRSWGDCPDTRCKDCGEDIG